MLPGQKQPKNSNAAALIKVKDASDLVEKMRAQPVFKAFEKNIPFVPVTDSPEVGGPASGSAGTGMLPPLIYTIPEALADIAAKHMKVEVKINDSLDETWTVTVDIDNLKKEVNEAMGGLLHTLQTCIDQNNLGFENFYSVLFSGDQYDFNDSQFIVNSMTVRPVSDKPKNILDKNAEESRLQHNALVLSYEPRHKEIAMRMTQPIIEELCYQTEVKMQPYLVTHKQQKIKQWTKEIKQSEVDKESADKGILAAEQRIADLKRNKVMASSPGKKKNIESAIAKLNKEIETLTEKKREQLNLLKREQKKLIKPQ